MNIRQKREIDLRNQDRDRQYAEEKFLARHARERLHELIARKAPSEMIRRVEDEISQGARGKR